MKRNGMEYRTGLALVQLGEVSREGGGGKRVLD